MVKVSSCGPKNETVYFFFFSGGSDFVWLTIFLIDFLFKTEERSQSSVCVHLRVFIVYVV